MGAEGFSTAGERRRQLETALDGEKLSVASAPLGATRYKSSKS